MRKRHTPKYTRDQLVTINTTGGFANGYEAVVLSHDSLTNQYLVRFTDSHLSETYVFHERNLRPG